MHPSSLHDRLRFIHLAWLALSGTAALAGLLAGAAGIPIITLGSGALITALAGLALPVASPTGQGALIVVWTLIALIFLILTGGTASPLITMLAIAPMVALMVGALRMAAEAAVFSGLALLILLAATGAGLLPSPLPGIGPALAPFAFAAFVTLAVIIWMAARERVVAAKPGKLTGTAAPPPQPQTPPIPSDAGLAVLEVAPEGRLRVVHGDCFGLRTLRPGLPLRGIFQSGEVARALEAGLDLTSAPARLACGAPVRVTARHGETGARIAIIADAAGAEPAPQASVIADLEEKLRKRTEFFASLGHDLKTPLNAILGYAEVMQARLLGPLPEAYAEYPAIIHESGTDLLLLVDDILDLARADAGQPRFDLEPVDLTASAESIIRQLTGQAARAGVKLKLKSDGEVWAEADARAVRQIWQNLVSNAIKYSGPGKTVLLETAIDAGAVRLSVTDRGSGIAAADLDKLTQPFTQAAGAKPGTGLGLSVVRRFAELHGGTMRIESKLGRGTRVTVNLPRAHEGRLAPLDEAAQ